MKPEPVRIRGTVACEPEAVVRFFAEKQIAPALTVHESGQLSIWLQRSLSELGLTVSCVDARVAHKVLSARLNKSDAADAEGLAQLARTGWLTPSISAASTLIGSEHSSALGIGCFVCAVTSKDISAA